MGPAAVFLLVLGLSGCRAVDRPPPVDVTLAGVQLPVELTRSWLRAAEGRQFVTEAVWPMRYAQDGFERLAAGECDLALTDRPLTPPELERFGEQDVEGRRLGFWGWGLYVNTANPLDAIFARHLEMVLQGRIQDWSELAGDQIPDFQGPISVYGLPKGTRTGMQLAHLARIWFADPTWTVCATDQAVVEQVRQDPRALGFAGIGYDGDGVRYLGLRMTRLGQAAYPSIEEIESERYGLAKVIYAYYLAPPTPAVQAVLDYLSSPAGHEAMLSTDVWPTPTERAPVRTPS